MYINFTRRAGQTWLPDQDTQAIRFIETPRNEVMLSLVEGFDGDLDGCDRTPDRYRQIGQMVQKTDTARLDGDRWRLERMLEKLSEDRVIDRLGLKGTAGTDRGSLGRQQAAVAGCSSAPIRH